MKKMMSWILPGSTKDIVIDEAIALSIVIATEEIDSVEAGHTLHRIPTCTTKVTIRILLMWYAWAHIMKIR